MGQDMDAADYQSVVAGLATACVVCLVSTILDRVFREPACRPCASLWAGLLFGAIQVLFFGEPAAVLATGLWAWLFAAAAHRQSPLV
jgi:hypothetical protein